MLRSHTFSQTSIEENWGGEGFYDYALWFIVTKYCCYQYTYAANNFFARLVEYRKGQLVLGLRYNGHKWQTEKNCLEI